MSELIALLVNSLAQIEAHIDFPEEDLPQENRQTLIGDIEKLLRGTRQLIATNHYGEILRGGIKTVIVGEPNAGKSSLLNFLVGRERALVSPEPGTTRDYLEEMITVGPHALRLIDTAGLNLTPSPLEKRGIEKTLEQAAGANLFLWVIDSTRPLPELPPQILVLMNSTNTVAVLNKNDLPPFASRTLPRDFMTVSISSLTGNGFEALQILIAKLADAMRPETGDEIVAINARHAHALEQAAACLVTACDKLKRHESTELISSDLRGALSAFGEISGKIDNENVLDRLFSTFCIGK